ncbi:MAG: hypothetical protein K1Y01_10415 [Vicinamibacteria bacterium]|nr:hypothetical protein [Vicinamibacteria bacterium]
MRGHQPEVFAIRPLPAWRYWANRLTAAAWRRLRRLGPADEFKRENVRSAAAFTISSNEPSFDEVEAIVFDPRVLEAIEAEPRAPLSLELGEPRLPTGFEALGWAKRPRPAPVYDIVPLGMELDVLELRMAELHAVVDRFVVVECERSFCGIRKPLLFERNRGRFERFRGKIEHVLIDPAPVDAAFPDRVRRIGGIAGETPSRESMWRRLREIPFEEDAVIISSDVDEIPARNFVHLVKQFEPPGPVRLRAPAFRYHFRLRDDEATNFVFVIKREHLAFLDHHPGGFRSIPGGVLGCRGGAHLTSFLRPLGLVAKFAMHAEWWPPLVPFVRNEFDEVRTMMRRGHWFTRPAQPYDPERDPEGLIPEAARLNRDRYSHFWSPVY